MEKKIEYRIRLKPKIKNVLFTAQIPENLRDAIKKAAESNNMSMAELTRQLFESFLESSGIELGHR